MVSKDLLVTLCIKTQGYLARFVGVFKHCECTPQVNLSLFHQSTDR